MEIARIIHGACDLGQIFQVDLGFMPVVTVERWFQKSHLAGQPTIVATGASTMKLAGIGCRAPAGPRRGLAGAAVATMWPVQLCRRIAKTMTTYRYQ